MSLALWGEQKVELEVTKPPMPILQLHAITVVAINSSLLPKGRQYKVSVAGQAEPEPRATIHMEVSSEHDRESEVNFLVPLTRLFPPDPLQESTKKRKRG